MKRALSAVQQFALCLAVGACAIVVEPVGPVRVRAPEVVTAAAAPTPPDLRFSVPIEITNAGSQPIMYMHCGWHLEKAVAGNWVFALAPVCPAMSFPGDEIEILPGATFTTTLPAHQTWFSAGLANSITGTYRAVVFLHTKTGKAVSPSDRISNSFNVTQ